MTSPEVPWWWLPVVGIGGFILGSFFRGFFSRLGSHLAARIVGRSERNADARDAAIRVARRQFNAASGAVRDFAHLAKYSGEEKQQEERATNMFNEFVTTIHGGDDIPTELLKKLHESETIMKRIFRLSQTDRRDQAWQLASDKLDPLIRELEGAFRQALGH